MRERIVLTLIIFTALLVGCAPPPAPTPTPTAPAPTALPPTPGPTATPDPLSTDNWGSLAVAEAGFSIRFPPTWQATVAEVDAGAGQQGMDLAGPEGRIELRWGTGFGGACGERIALTVADGLLPACHLVAADGTQRWEQIDRPLKTTTFSARGETADASAESAEVIRRIFATLAFDPAALATPPAPAPAAAAGEVIVDTAHLALTGDWYFFDGRASYNGDCLVALPGVDARAAARPALPAAGLYEVFGWWCGNPNTDQTRTGVVRVHRSLADPAPQELVVDYTTGAGAWVSLGAFNLQNGAFVEVLSAVDGRAPADAFRFVPRGPAATEVPATPAATPGPRVSNHPPSPLQQVTQGDLAARLALNDPFYTAMTLTPTALSFDDCADFPREGCAGERKGTEAIVAYQGITLTYRVADDFSLVALAGAELLDPWTTGQPHPQRVFLRGSDAGGAWAVHYRPDNTWRLLRFGAAGAPPGETRLTAAQGALIRALAEKHSTVSAPAAGGGVTLYGLGRTVALSAADRAALIRLAEELAR